MRYVKPTEKQKIIQVSVDRLYSEAEPKYPDYSEKPGYTSNTQQYAEEKFMNSLRSEYYYDLEMRNSKSHSKMNHSPSRTSYYSSSKLSFKPKSGQMRYGLAERPKKKFVKKLSDANRNLKQTPPHLKKSETLKAGIENYRNDLFGTLDIIEKRKNTYQNDFIIIKNSTVSNTLLTPDRYHLHAATNHSHGKNQSSKKWNFDNNRDHQPSRDKLRLVESEFFQRPSDSQAISRSISKISIQSRQNSKCKPALQKMKTNFKSISKKSTSSKALGMSSNDNSASPSKIKIKKSKTQVSKTTKTSTNKSVKIIEAIDSRPSASMPQMIAQPNADTDDEPKYIHPLACFTIDFDHAKPVKPSNIMPSGHMPELIACELDHVSPIDEYRKDDDLDDRDLTAKPESRAVALRLQLSYRGRQPSTDGQQADDGQMSQASVTKDIRIEHESNEDFDFDDDDDDINDFMPDLVNRNVVYVYLASDK